MKRIILFIKKFFAWILSFFFDRSKTTKKKRAVLKVRDAKLVSAKDKDKITFVNRDEDMGESHIVDVYPYTEAKELKSIQELIDELEKKVIDINDENLEKELEDLKEIKETITKAIEAKEEKKKEEIKEQKQVKEEQDVKEQEELQEKIVEEQKVDKKEEVSKEQEPLNVIQEEDIKEVLTETINDKELNINTDEKINNIKKEINKIVDDRLNTYEKNIIEKAFYKYDKVNYVVTTTMEIEDLERDIKELKDDIKINKHKKAYYVDKVKEIEKKIERLKKINKNPSVYKELERLKEDFYTKSIDKYDLLYNKEVFISLEEQCDNIIDFIDEKEQEEKKRDKEEKEKKEEERQKERARREEIQELREKEREQRRREQEEHRANIIRRYIDLKKANTILMTNSIIHHERLNDKDILRTLQDDYDDFLKGEENSFNFDRNKNKTEVCKLYNNLVEILSNEQGIEFTPLEHINYQYQELLEETLYTKEAVEKVTFNKTGQDVMLEPKSVMVSDKLNNELQKEKVRNSELGLNSRILVRKMKNE